jgi:carboxylesterase type B
LRWKAPQNSDKWNGILNATKNGNITIQFKKSRGKVIGNEDCPSTVEHLKIIKN